MTSFNSMRRDLLRAGSLGVAGAAIPAASFAAATTGDAPGSPSASAPGSGVFFNVHAYGATGDGKTLDTDAINRAIEAAAAAGGGVVFFPAGNYLCFSIHLKSNVHLHLDKAQPSSPLNRPSPARPLATTAALTMQPSPRPNGTPIRTTAITTGTTRCSGAKTFTTSPSPAPASSGARDWLRR